MIPGTDSSLLIESGCKLVTLELKTKHKIILNYKLIEILLNIIIALLNNTQFLKKPINVIEKYDTKTLHFKFSFSKKYRPL